LPIEVPFTNKPEDINLLLQRLSEGTVPTGTIGADYIEQLGFNAASSNHLFSILVSLGFIDEKNQASDTWTAYVGNENRAMLLATTIQTTYKDLFKFVLCPYLADDESLVEFFKHTELEKSDEIDLVIQTFRSLCESADFQETIWENDALPVKKERPEIKVNPNMQITIQVHIDPTTPDDKIETIFKNMRKYLLGKES
jgi:hypothetical protein